MRPALRVRALLVLGWLVFAGLAARLYALQVVRHEQLQEAADRRRRRLDVLPARRGAIVDREGRPLAVDRPVLDVALVLPEADPTLDAASAVARALRLDPAALSKEVRGARALARQGEERPVLARGRGAADRARAQRAAARHENVLSVEQDPRERDAFAVALARTALLARDELLLRLSRLAGVAPGAAARLLEEREDAVRAIADRPSRVRAWQEPVPVARDVSWEVAAAVEERGFENRGVLVARRSARRTPQGPVLGHVVGYLSQRSAEDLARLRDEGLLLDDPDLSSALALGFLREVAQGSRRSSDPVGRAGIEAALDERLAGTCGVRVLEAGAPRAHAGKDVAERGSEVVLDVAPIDGEDVRLTIDLDVEAALEEAIDRALAEHGEPDAGAAAVALDVRSGDVLAFASAPRFDPGEIGRSVAALAADQRRPLLHRASAAFPPGSTFKALTAVALFGEGRLDPGTRFSCEGALDVKHRQRWKCDAVHGPSVGLEEALARSCNVFFFRSSDASPGATGSPAAAVLADAAVLAGFGRRSGAPVPDEREGLVPDLGWKRRRLARATRTRDARAEELVLAEAKVAAAVEPEARAAAEAARESARARLREAEARRTRFSRDLDVSAFEARNAAIGQGDLLATPLQVARLGAVIASGGPAPRPRITLDAPVEEEPGPRIDPAVLALVRSGLEGCVRRGTASSLRDLDLAGKTGTAELGKDRPNVAWFMGYYPASRPEIAFAIVLDRTRSHGGDACTPVARTLVQAWERRVRSGGGR